MKRTRELMVAGLLLGAVLGLCAATAQAGTVYWVTSGGDYGTTGNWSTGALPTASDTAVFNQAGLNGATTVTSNASSRSVLGFVFNNTGTTALHSVSGTTRSFVLGSGGVTVNSGAGAVTLGDPAGAGALDSYFKLDADQTWANDSSSLLTVAYTAGATAAITNNSSTTPHTLTLAGSGSGGITVQGASRTTAREPPRSRSTCPVRARRPSLPPAAVSVIPTPARRRCRPAR